MSHADVAVAEAEAAEGWSWLEHDERLPEISPSQIRGRRGRRRSLEAATDGGDGGDGGQDRGDGRTGPEGAAAAAIASAAFVAASGIEPSGAPPKAREVELDRSDGLEGGKEDAALSRPYSMYALLRSCFY